MLRDVVIGLLIAGAVGAWVPDSFWQRLFLTGHPLAARIWGPLIGPVISLLSFVCSIGNVPLAAVLWNGGISFGGVVAFIFADLIIIPILIIYRKYYGTRMMLVLAGLFYVTMVLAGYVVEFVFSGLGLVPAARTAKVGETGVTWNYTTYLNIVFLLVAAALLVRFFRSGGVSMLRMMGGSAGEAGPGHGAHAVPSGPAADSGHSAHSGPGITPRTTVLPTCDPCAPSRAAVSASFISDTGDPRGHGLVRRREGDHMRGTRQIRPRPGAGAGPAAAGRGGAAAAAMLAGALAAAAAPGAAATAAARPASTHPTHPGAAASWRIIKTTRGRDMPAVTAVTAAGPDHAWAFASTLARPVAWRLTGRRWAAVPFPGQRGDLVTAAASSAPGNVWAFTAQPGGAGRAVRWNGRHWAIAGRFGQAVGDAVVFGPADVWVFGQPLSPGGGLGAWHYDGRSWRRDPAAAA